MHPTKVGAAPAQTGTTPVELPGRITTNHQSTFDSTPIHKTRKPRAISGFFRGLYFALFLVAFVVAAAFLVGYVAAHVPTAVVILGGLVLVGLVVARGASPS